ncbi:MAG TPA: DDE-type integrase/transposase/recombinase [Candidatus Saccharimonadales bacterium]|nr:DDE-type integrase/transposase/recombinase [Candidatus Saccharimonadales bacterium]
MGEADVGFKSKLCAFFGLDRSIQYKRHVRAAHDQELAEQIRAVTALHKHYGHRRIATELGTSKNRVRRVMRAHGIPSPTRRKKYVKANKGSKPAPPNLLKAYELEQANGTMLRQPGLVALYPHHIWAEDFTYIWFHGRFYYLATVIDLYTRQIVGWALGTRHDTSLITAALMDGVSHHKPPALLHNDRGSEYLSKLYQTILAKARSFLLRLIGVRIK